MFRLFKGGNAGKGRSRSNSVRNHGVASGSVGARIYLLLTSGIPNADFPLKVFLGGFDDDYYAERISSGELKLYSYLPYIEIINWTKYSSSKQVYIFELPYSESQIKQKICEKQFKLSESVSSYFDALEYLSEKDKRKNKGEEDESIINRIKEKPDLNGLSNLNGNSNYSLRA